MPAVGAVVAVGWTAASATMIFAAVAQVGLALTVVGAVTGNATLTKVGGVLGLVGGVGGLASGLGTAATGGVVDAAVGEAGSAVAETGLNSGGFIGPEPAGAFTTVGDSVATEGLINAAPIDYSGSGFADASAGVADSGTQQLGALGDTPSLAQQTFPEVGAPTGPGIVDAPSPVGAPTAPGMQGPMNPLGATQPNSGGWLSNILGEKGNQSLLMEGAKLIGGGLSGAEKSRIADEELKRKVGVDEYNKMVLERQNANASAQPTLAGKLAYAPNPGLFKKPQQTVGQFKGLINARA